MTNGGGPSHGQERKKQPTQKKGNGKTNKMSLKRKRLLSGVAEKGKTEEGK